MTLQEEMFALVSEWKTSGLTKRTFLADKPKGCLPLKKLNPKDRQAMVRDVSEVGHEGIKIMQVQPMGVRIWFRDHIL